MPSTLRLPRSLLPGLGAVLALWALCALLSMGSDRHKSADWYRDQFVYLPSGKLLRPMTVGYEQAASSYLWVQGMLYFANSYLAGEGYPWLGHIVNIVTELDPDFEYAYEFGGLILQDDRASMPQALAILERGIEKFPANWNLRIYAAITTLTLDSNYERAAGYLAPLKEREDVPAYVREMAYTMGTRSAKGQDFALDFLMRNYLAAQSPLNREIILRKMAETFGFRPFGPGEQKVLSGLMQVLDADSSVFSFIRQAISEYLRRAPSPQTLKVLDLLHK